eukprot:3407847-Prymnesium_polylepis.1
MRRTNAFTQVSLHGSYHASPASVFGQFLAHRRASEVRPLPFTPKKRSARRDAGVAKIPSPCLR